MEDDKRKKIHSAITNFSADGPSSQLYSAGLQQPGRTAIGAVTQGKTARHVIRRQTRFPHHSSQLLTCDRLLTFIPVYSDYPPEGRGCSGSGGGTKAKTWRRRYVSRSRD